MSAPIPAKNGLTAEELDQARLLVEQAHAAVVGATKGLSAAQWNFKPAPDRWSIAENLEHVVNVQDRVLGPVLDNLTQAPAPSPSVDRALVDSIVIHQFPSRLGKFPSPEFVRPVAPVPEDLLQRLAANRERFCERLISTPELRDHVLPSPPLKAISKGVYDVMDGYQWILGAAAHTQRHVMQMLEVKANLAFPE
jgi:hypothetical protein